MMDHTITTEDPVGKVRGHRLGRFGWKGLAVVGAATAAVALSVSSASADYTDFGLTVSDGTTTWTSASTTAPLSSSGYYSISATGLEDDHEYYVSTCIDPGDSGSLSSAPSCAFFSGEPNTFDVFSDEEGNLDIAADPEEEQGFVPSASFTDVHNPSGPPITCAGVSSPGAQCAVVIVDAEDHSLASDFDRVLITVD